MSFRPEGNIQTSANNIVLCKDYYSQNRRCVTQICYVNVMKCCPLVPWVYNGNCLAELWIYGGKIDGTWTWLKSLFFVITRGQSWPSGIVVTSDNVHVCVSVRPPVCQSRVCPRDNSWPVQARITKFGSVVQNTLVEIPVVSIGDCAWYSR